MRALNGARRTSVRGFTMLELVVTVALTSTMFALLLPWVLNLITLSSANLDASAATRAAASVARTWDKDIAGAVSCPATGSPVHVANSTTFALFTTTGPDATPAAEPHLVVWSLTNGELARAATPADLASPTCGALDPEADPLADPLADPTTGTWVPYAAGVTTAGTGGGSLRVFSDAAPTEPRLVTVDLRIASPDGGAASAPVTASYTLPFFYTGLS